MTAIADDTEPRPGSLRELDAHVSDRAERADVTLPLEEPDAFSKAWNAFAEIASEFGYAPADDEFDLGGES